MANTASNIKNSWTLLTFAKKFGRMQVGSFKSVDKETGEIRHFKSCAFSEGDKVTFVGFSPKLGELKPHEIAAQKDDLQVVEWENPETEKHGYTLCKKGQDAWEDVNLF